jgi:hypothetical protein
VPLTRAELTVAARPLRTPEIEQFTGDVPALPRWRAEFVRGAGSYAAAIERWPNEARITLTAGLWGPIGPLGFFLSPSDADVTGR